jgi:3-hydroxyacyl-[acyl-carrier-protein] dehydratase
VIEDGVKLDNLIQIGHNVRVGRHTAMAGCVGVAGSATIGAHCTVGGGAIVLGHLTLADHVHISAASVVTRSISKPGHYTGVFPIDDNAHWEKNAATLKQLYLLRDGPQGNRKDNKIMMDIHQILKQLPHRYPILLVDRVLELEKGKRIKALKNVTINEPFFTGHFPHRPVMPGVLMLEAMAQAAALLAFDTLGVTPDDKTVYYFAGIDGARFKRPVEPGDQLVMDVSLDRMKAGIFKFKGVTRVGEEHRLRGRAHVHHAQHCLRDMGLHPSHSPRGPGRRTRQLGQRGAVHRDRSACEGRAGTTIGAHCVIEGHTTIGRDNRIFQFNSLGAIPQDKKYAGEPCELVIGERNTIREFCTFNIGSPGGGAVTRVGNDNWIMAYVHLAHDCIVGNHTIFANNTQLAGHVEVGDWVILGGFTVVTSSSASARMA